LDIRRGSKRPEDAEGGGKIPSAAEGVEKFRLELGRPRAFAFAASKGLLYRLISIAASGSIVFEEPLRRIPSMDRAALVPFGADDPPPVDRAAARRRLGLESDTFAILFFGFLSPYKGLDRLLEILDLSEISGGLQGREVRLIVAGDANPNHAGNRRYLRSVESVKQRAREQGALVAGFIEEEEIGLYYAAADVVLIPYRIFFSSSYALSLAISYQRPVLLSRPLERYFEGSDFREAARAAGLTPEDLVFDFTAEDLSRKVLSLAANQDRHLRFLAAMKRARSWSSVASRLLEVLEADGRRTADGDLPPP
jgi:glycosyltransferase involved in cell wall biosynthesis